MLLEVSITLERVIADLESMGELRDEIRGLPDLKIKVDAIYHEIFIGDGELNPPLKQRTSFVEKKIEYVAKKAEKLASARTLGPRERMVMYGALITALGSALKHFLDSH